MKHVYYSLICIAFCLLFWTQQVSAQFEITVHPCVTNEQVIALFDSVLFSTLPPQTIANLEFHGDPTSIGYFNNAYFSGFQNPRGIVMTNGEADDVDKSNICNSAQNASTNNNGVDGDQDLTLLGGNSSFDGCIVEFDFKPILDSVRFNFVFASEEYHDNVFAGWNDMFGLFLSGPEINGPYSYEAINIALVPGTNTGVSINTVNFGSGGQTCTGKPNGCTNCEWFKDNSQNTDPAFHQFVYDGLTKAIMAHHGLQAGEWYHIKIAISDGGDAIYDSAIFLEEKSFFTGSIKAKIGPKIMR